MAPPDPMTLTGSHTALLISAPLSDLFSRAGGLLSNETHVVQVHVGGGRPEEKEPQGNPKRLHLSYSAGRWGGRR